MGSNSKFGRVPKVLRIISLGSVLMQEWQFGFRFIWFREKFFFGVCQVRCRGSEPPMKGGRKSSGRKWGVKAGSIWQATHFFARGVGKKFLLGF